MLLFNGISDHHGVRRMVESIKKQEGVYYARLASPATPVLATKCQKCGEPLLPEQAFCSNCGAKVSDIEEAAKKVGVIKGRALENSFGSLKLAS